MVIIENDFQASIHQTLPWNTCKSHTEIDDNSFQLALVVQDMSVQCQKLKEVHPYSVYGEPQ